MEWLIYAVLIGWAIGFYAFIESRAFPIVHPEEFPWRIGDWVKSGPDGKLYQISKITPRYLYSGELIEQTWRLELGRWVSEVYCSIVGCREGLFCSRCSRYQRVRVFYQGIEILDGSLYVSKDGKGFSPRPGCYLAEIASWVTACDVDWNWKIPTSYDIDLKETE